MASYDLAAIESNEYANPPHSDTIENTQPRDIPDPGEAITTNDLGAAHGDSSSEESYRQTEADELWKVLKAETGYSSYTDYLKAYIPTHPHLKRLLLRCPLNYKLPKFTQLPKLTILYLSKDKDSRPRVLPRCESASVTSIVTILRQPPANVAVQIVLWNAEAGDYDRSVENALGLGLKINPQFFGALYGPKKRLLDPGYVTIGGFVATVVPYYSPDRQDAIHTVLIARKELESTRTNAVEEEIGGVLPFQYPAVDTNALDTPQNDTGPHTERYDPRTNEHSNYARLLGWYLQKEGKPAVEVGELCLWSLMPLLYLNEMQVHGECQDLRHELGKLQRFALFKWHEPERDQIISDLPQKRFQLRQLVEDSKDDLDHLSKYIRPQTSFFQQVEDEVKKTHEQAFRLEAQIRDFLQLQVGEWALQESKRSIELSNRQMDEGKRVKIFTILAFVYVPLNLATSIFGMNLSELNGSGKNLKDFLVTAIVALLITAVSWFLTEEINKYLLYWRRRSQVGERFTIGARLGMFVWLQKNGPIGWWLEAGAWWRILINSENTTSELVRIYNQFVVKSAYDRGP